VAVRCSGSGVADTKYSSVVGRYQIDEPSRQLAMFESSFQTDH
jgi:hypothetical protein